MNKLQFTLPSLESLYPNAPLIKGKITAVLSILPGIGKDELFCKNSQTHSHCRVSFYTVKTPEIYSSFGTAFAGEEVTINSKFVYYHPESNLQIYNWAKLGK